MTCTEDPSTSSGHSTNKDIDLWVNTSATLKQGDDVNTGTKVQSIETHKYLGGFC